MDRYIDRKARARRSRIAAAALWLAAGGAALPVAAGDGQDSSGQAIIGAWIVSIRPAGAPAAHLSFATFAPKGVFGGAGDTFGPAGTTTNATGTWVALGSHRYASTFAGFVYANGVPASIAVITTSYVMQGADAFEGQADLKFCDLTLTHCTPQFAQKASVSGKRLGIDAERL